MTGIDRHHKLMRKRKRKPKAATPPSSRAMKQFGKKFTKAQWDYCCENDEFVKLCSTDLVAAERLAVQMLSSMELALIQADYEEDGETE